LTQKTLQSYEAKLGFEFSFAKNAQFYKFAEQIN